MLRGEGGQAVHAAPDLVLLPVKDDDQLPVVDALICVLRHIGGGDGGQLEVAAAPGQGQPGQHSSDAAAILRRAEGCGAEGAGNVVCGQVDDALVVALAVGQHRLEGLVVIVARLLDPGSHRSLFIIGDSRNNQVVPLQVIQLLQLRVEVFFRGGHLQHDGLGGGTLIDQLQVLVVARREVGGIHIQHALVDVQRLALFGVVFQNDGHDAPCAALDGGHALGLKFNDDFRQAHKITSFRWS